MKQLSGGFPDKGRAARTRRFAIGTHHHPLNMGGGVPRTGLAVAQLILRIQVIAASSTDERTRSPWMIDIEPVTACPTFVHADVIVTVIDHERRTAFAAHHLILPRTVVVDRHALFSSGLPHRVCCTTDLTVLLAPLFGYLLELA
jgi:hypothetical protein